LLEGGLRSDRLLVELEAEDLQGRTERGVDVHLLKFGLVQPRKIAEVLDDGADSPQALSGAGEQAGEVLAEVGQVDVLLQAGRLGGEPRRLAGEDLASSSVDL